ncbi:uncharacterized protein LOC127698277 [Mytilus californianus]|uniref:uncharacterized protein LOC127698277 n=1 Tax=Mytilus californianus TaxID=6549 RepID=UPI00224839C4|nr:uncharacterized protein LOC127698277 [Mytilus californianus]
MNCPIFLMKRRDLIAAVMEVKVFIVFSVLFCVVRFFPMIADASFIENNTNELYNKNSYLHLVLRHKRSVNNTSSDDGRSAIEKFYDDPNNKAMYLVFPLFVLIISTCCGLYFCDRCRKHLKKKKAEERKKESELLENQEQDEENKASTSNSIDGNSSDLNKSAQENGVANGSIALEMAGEINRNDTPLEDVENSPEVKAVNAVPIKHRETSFMTDVKNANKYDVEPPSKNSSSLAFTDDVKTNSSAPNAVADDTLNSDTNRNTIKHDSRIVNNESLKKEHVAKKLKMNESSKDSRVVPELKTEVSNNNNSDQQSEVIKPLPTTREIQVRNTHRRDSFKSASTVQSNKSLDRKSNGTRSSAAFHEKTTLPDVTKSYSKMDRKFTALSAEAIGEILQYYKDKKHMPDIIPDEDENAAPIRKRFKKAKYKVFNG